MTLQLKTILSRSRVLGFSYNGEKIGQGRDNVRKYMVENKEFTAEIDRQVRELLKNNSGYLPSEADNSDNTDGEQRRKRKQPKQLKNKRVLFHKNIIRIIKR